MIALGCRVSDLSYLTIIMKLRCGGVAPDDISLSRNHKMTHTVHTVHSSHSSVQCMEKLARVFLFSISWAKNWMTYMGSIEYSL